MTIASIVGAIAVLLTGISAGVFLTYQNSVLPGLGALDDRTFAKAMNSMNRAILNPAFMLFFIGSMVALAAAAIIGFILGGLLPAWLFAAAAIVYQVGVIFVTGSVNVPLNNALAKDNDRRAFEARWVRWNVVRTLSAIVAFALAIAGLLVS
jgi:uncharacterized membrane protein